MNGGERRLTAKGIAFFGALTVLFGLLHITDDIVRGETESFGGTGLAALVFVLFTVVYVFGLGWAWKERKGGYALVFVLSLFPFLFATFVSHALGVVGAQSLPEIAAAYTGEAVSVFFVFVSLASGLTALMALLLSLYALAVPKKG